MQYYVHYSATLTTFDDFPPPSLVIGGYQCSCLCGSYGRQFSLLVWFVTVYRRRADPVVLLLEET